MITSTLLGCLARFGSFSTQSELLCTQGLAYLLKTYECAASALAGEVAARTGIEIDDSLAWHAEVVHDDKARPDLEAQSVEGVPVVNIEAKLGAKLGADQLLRYVQHLQKYNEGEAALLVLVPQGRAQEAANETAKALGLPGPGPWHLNDGRPCGIAVISWDELFTALRGRKEERFNYELDQLQAMYRELSGTFIAPLADIEDLLKWRERKTDFDNVVKEATSRLTRRDRILPFGIEPLEDTSHELEDEGYRRRYVCSFAGDAESCFSIGVRDSFAGWNTPVWMRFHRDTGKFDHIRQRIEASTLDHLMSGGHIWIPLEVPLEVPGEQMIQSLVEQAEEIVRVAY